MKGAKNLNAILVDSNEVQYYTYLGPIFEALHNKQLDYNWLITDLELNWFPDNFLDYFDQVQISEGMWNHDNRYWISGDNLTKLVTDHKLQFIWGVLSGLDKKVQIDINNLSVVPFADGNTDLWKPGNTVQHPNADIEIVCWDSTLTLMISKDQSIIRDFMEYFKDSKDLDEYILED